ncbi:MAG: T9SS type A sorting domain-containing protein, partial [candidate division Zixibacteria bacterium]|nr:T9SS type A sorting domain-containing protein [candidate division Zixibacteria bacterium]
NPNFVVDGYHFAGPSPCIDAGNNNAPTLPPTDFDGNPRVADGDMDDSFFVDMGAYEYQPEGSGGFAKIVGGDGRDTGTKSSLSVPDKFSLLQNYPNPFNPATVVKFEIVQPAKVSLKIYNILGQSVKVLVDEEKVAGTYTTYWDGKDQNGQAVSSGIYFYKLDTGNFTEVKKMILIK